MQIVRINNTSVVHLLTIVFGKKGKECRKKTESKHQYCYEMICTRTNGYLPYFTAVWLISEKTLPFLFENSLYICFFP